ncbi:DNA-3-methyladenine glycosylase [Planotetraspora silvatica]|uniref:DNA-3-methyladenine glycosylase II n=1 Tax=Planotetraspora silvatica TaxID=234614 RepID=A0A8J3XV78_9ACTN|nr:DNA-3-methyladenine glycosylase 2 family protein [Planotetraspora silvatica]GII50298.1 DNA-3-methyladenine glycosylase [Planotetraspora silvatica]
MTSDYERQYRFLADRDPVLARLAEEYGHPNPFEWHDGGRTGSSNFAAMTLHIVGQQISAVVAFVVFDRIAAAVGGIPTPGGIIALGAERLRECGLSRAKAAYVLDLAHRQVSGLIDIEDMADLDDSAAIAALTAVKGIGLWSAQTFLIHQLHRSDVLPAGDVGIRRAIGKAWQREDLPTVEEARKMATTWAPYRTYAAALLWRSLRPADELSDPKARALSREVGA